METKDNNYLKLIKGLKANNLSANKPNLRASSQRIESLLSSLKGKGDEALDRDIDASVKVIRRSIDVPPENQINSYIEFGETYKYMLDDITGNSLNYDTMKKIALAYFDIADKSDDDRVRAVAESIANTLKEHKDKLSESK